jgi:hypothetical protein
LPDDEASASHPCKLRAHEHGTGPFHLSVSLCRKLDHLREVEEDLSNRDGVFRPRSGGRRR